MYSHVFLLFFEAFLQTIWRGLTYENALISIKWGDTTNTYGEVYGDFMFNTFKPRTTMTNYVPSGKFKLAIEHG